MAHFQEMAEPDVQAVEKYFGSSYMNSGEARWKMARFCAARGFLDINHGKLEEFYIKGSPKGSPAGGSLDPRFVYALWGYYSTCKDEFVDPFVPVELMLGFARRRPTPPPP